MGGSGTPGGGRDNKSASFSRIWIFTTITTKRFAKLENPYIEASEL